MFHKIRTIIIFSAIFTFWFILVFYAYNHVTASHGNNNYPAFDGSKSGGGFCNDNNVIDCYYPVEIVDSENYQAYRGSFSGITYPKSIGNSSSKADYCIDFYGVMYSYGSACGLLFDLVTGTVPNPHSWSYDREVSDTETKDFNYVILHIRNDQVQDSNYSITAYGRRVHVDNISVSPNQPTTGNSFSVSWASTNAVNAYLSWSGPISCSNSGLVPTNNSTSCTASDVGTAQFVLTAYGPGHNGSTDVSMSKSVSIGSGGGTYTLNVAISGGGSGTVTGPGITCGAGGSDCSESYPVAGTGVTLSASSALGSTFQAWSGDCSGSSSSCSLTMNSSKNVTATFDCSGCAPPPPGFSCTLSFSPSSISQGAPSTATWVTNDSDGVFQFSCNGDIGAGDLTQASSSTVVAPSTTQECTLLNVVTSSGLTGSCSATISVLNAGPPPPPPPVNSGEVHGYVHRSEDGNLNKDSGELEFDGVQITFYESTSGCSGLTQTSTYTTGSHPNGAGYYEFSGLVAGRTYGVGINTSSMPNGHTLAPGESSLVCVGPGPTGYNEDFALVEILPPTASVITVTEPNYCVSGPAATVRWTYYDSSGSPQSAYQVQIDDQGSFNNPEVDSGKVTCDACRSYFSGQGFLQFNTTHKARVKVWNSSDQASNWTESSSFKTPNHVYPNVNTPHQFIWSPANPAVNSLVQFTDRTFFDPTSNNKQWLWTFVPAGGGSGSSTTQNPSYTFNQSGIYQVTESVRDNAMLSGQYCSLTRAVNIQKPVPIWKEVAPR